MQKQNVSKLLSTCSPLSFKTNSGSWQYWVTLSRTLRCISCEHSKESPTTSTQAQVCAFIHKEANLPSPVFRGLTSVTAGYLESPQQEPRVREKGRKYLCPSKQRVTWNRTKGPLGSGGTYVSILQKFVEYQSSRLNSKLIINILRPFWINILNYVSKLGGEMCNFEACLICFGLGNIFQPPALYSEMWYVCELNVI